MALSLASCQNENSGEENNSLQSQASSESTELAIKDTIERFITNLQEGNSDMISFAATDEIILADDCWENLYDEIEGYFEEELAQERFQVLLEGASFEVMPIDDFNLNELNEEHECSINIKVSNLKQWDNTLSYYGAQYALEQKEYDSRDLDEPDIYQDLLEELYDDIPTIDTEIPIYIFENKDGTYSLDGINFFSNLGIEETLDIGGQLMDTLFPMIIKPADEAELGSNQKIIRSVINSYNKMVDEKNFDFESIRKSITSVTDGDKVEIEDTQDALEWYAGLSNDEKKKVDEYIAEAGKISYLSYSSYSSYYSSESDDPVEVYFVYMCRWPRGDSYSATAYYNACFQDYATYLYADRLLVPLERAYRWYLSQDDNAESSSSDEESSNSDDSSKNTDSSNSSQTVLDLSEYEGFTTVELNNDIVASLEENDDPERSAVQMPIFDNETTNVISSSASSMRDGITIKFEYNPIPLDSLESVVKERVNRQVSKLSEIDPNSNITKSNITTDDLYSGDGWALQQINYDVLYKGETYPCFEIIKVDDINGYPMIIHILVNNYIANENTQDVFEDVCEIYGIDFEFE